MDRMNLVLHIGTEKTGTTFLQSWLYNNRQALSENGIFLSDRIQKPNNRKLVGYFVQRLDDWCRQQGITTREQRSRFFDGFLKDFEAELRAAEPNHHTMIITSEHFHSRLRAPEEMKKLKNFLDRNFATVTVLCYFREQSQMAKSAYSTTVRAGSTATFEKFLETVSPENYYFNFLEIARNWSGLFGRENCDFRVYDLARFPENDLRLDFLSRLPRPLDHSYLSFDRTRGNESLTRVETALYRLINQHEPYINPNGGGLNPSNRKLKQAVSRCGILKLYETNMPKSEKIFEAFKETNIKLFEEFFEEDFLFQKASDAPEGSRVLEIDTENLAHDLETLVDRLMKIMKSS
ncbi:hypothetical protein DZD18_12040 [Rhodobacteraceae bacterium W635]|uniref:hypothetical protein n=1 Tax=Nioella halotolerans TaxID=2303578 RepID=UPI000E3D63F0|nr:hypothetical protein DZD18_12040 [Rhodobacteraceae bacterium W635]